MKIAILGAGAFGTALGGVLAEKGCDVDYYDALLERERLTDTVAGTTAIVLCVPSTTAPHILPHLPKNVPLIVATKGFLTEEIFIEFEDWMVLSGPGYAEDIKAAKPTHLTATDMRVIEAFSTEYLDFDYTIDRRGVLLCGALKNVYAILAGLKNLEPETAEHREFLQKAAKEMKEILAANGADSKTMDLNCGKGDLEITCYYPSRNYELGRRLGKNPDSKSEKTVEGMATLKRIKRGEIELPQGLELMGQIIELSKNWN